MRNQSISPIEQAEEPGGSEWLPEDVLADVRRRVCRTWRAAVSGLLRRSIAHGMSFKKGSMVRDEFEDDGGVAMKGTY